jgi:hypothetical protein
MSLAGDPARCTAYLMGNHTIAEQMYRHDPSVMLYAPLRKQAQIARRGLPRLRQGQRPQSRT